MEAFEVGRVAFPFVEQADLGFVFRLGIAA
jgi:hypothetical protein